MLRKVCRDDFERYAFTCFKAFGDRVKYWITFNEPRGLTIQGYDTGIQAPGRCSLLGHWFCKEGKSSVEPYVVAHNILLSHAAAYHTYQRHFKVKNTDNRKNEHLRSTEYNVGKCKNAEETRWSNRDVVRCKMV